MRVLPIPDSGLAKVSSQEINVLGDTINNPDRSWAISLAMAKKYLIESGLGVMIFESGTNIFLLKSNSRDCNPIVDEINKDHIGYKMITHAN